jgi:hypothetical protein
LSGRANRHSKEIGGYLHLNLGQILENIRWVVGWKDTVTTDNDALHLEAIWSGAERIKNRGRRRADMIVKTYSEF